MVRRWAFHLLAIASGLLFLLMFALAVRSFYVVDAILWQRTRANRIGAEYVGAELLAGYVVLHHSVKDEGVTFRPSKTRSRWMYASGWRTNERSPIGSTTHHWAGFGVHFVSPEEFSQEYFRSATVVIPDWFLILLFALAPAVWVRRWRRHRMHLRAGHCQRCGYDLRATPERCPECGTVPSRS